MPLIGRQFVTIVEFNKLEQRVKRIESNLGIQTQGRAAVEDYVIAKQSDTTYDSCKNTRPLSYF